MTPPNGTLLAKIGIYPELTERDKDSILNLLEYMGIPYELDHKKADIILCATTDCANTAQEKVSGEKTFVCWKGEKDRPIKGKTIFISPKELREWLSSLSYAQSNLSMLQLMSATTCCFQKNLQANESARA